MRTHSATSSIENDLTVTQCGNGAAAVKNGNSAGSKKAGGGSGGGGAVSSAEMQELVPQYGGNSRIFAARSLIEGGNLSQDVLKDFDIATYSNQLAGLNSRAVRQQTRADGTIQTFSGAVTGSTTPANYRRYVAQADRDARRIWNSASDATKEAWAARGEITSAKTSGNMMSRRITRDLSRRFNNQQERAAAERRAAKAARRSAASNDLSGLF